MKRKDFIQQTLASMGFLGVGLPAVGVNTQRKNTLLSTISRANDQSVDELVVRYQQSRGFSRNREKSGFVLALSSAYCSEDSVYYRNDDLIAPMEQVIASFLHDQYPDGTLDSGNLQSPPDTAFMIEQLWRSQALLQKVDSDQTELLLETLQHVLLNAGEGLAKGGVHTPNHRWAISAALAGLHFLYPNQKYVDRINTWLDEGIGQDADGQHPERSPNYDSAVNNPCLLDIAILMDRPELLDYVRKNLEMTLYLLEPDGEVDTIASRRQDQGRKFIIYRYYLPYRYMAIRDQNPRFAEITRYIEANYTDTLGAYLADFLLHPELANSLPESESLPENYVKHFQNTKLVRIRRGKKTATIFGGTDWHLGHGVWSGLSHNPTFFKLRKGEAILESLRMSPAFFSTGYFRSNGLQVNEDQYELREVRKVPYHLPLSKKFRNDSGEYKMSPDGRFYSKMDFENRPKEYKTLRSKVTVKEISNSGAFEVDISMEETINVAVTIELCFRKGGFLSGVVPMQNETDGFFLRDGEGSYRVGDDVITFGPGHYEHSRVEELYSEQYSVHNGSIRQDGFRVYMTVTSPFDHTFKIG